jgi:fructokinase
LAQRGPKSRLTIQNFIRSAPATCLKILDINLRKPFCSKALVDDSLKMANVLKLNDAELAEIAAMFGLNGTDRHAQMMELLQRFDLKYVFVTCGSRGAMATKGDGIIEHRGFKVEVNDTIGAGDAFTATVSHCLLRGISLAKTLAIANRLAAWVASESGGMPEISDGQRRKMLAEIA